VSLAIFETIYYRLSKCYGLNFVLSPQNLKNIDIVTPSACVCDFIWNFFRVENKVKKKLLRWALIQNDYFLSKRKFRHKDRQTECHRLELSCLQLSQGTPKISRAQPEA
jgi:hypothetical protein